MTDTTDLLPETTIPFSRLKVGFFAFVMGGLALMLLPTFSAGWQDNLDAVTLFGLPIATFLFIFFARRFFTSKPGLLFSQDGFTDNASGTAVGFVPWNEVVGVQRQKVKGQKLVTVIVRDPSKYWKQGGVYKRVSNWLSQKMFGSPIVIPTTALAANAKQIEKLIESYRVGAMAMPASRRSVQPAEPAAPAKPSSLAWSGKPAEPREIRKPAPRAEARRPAPPLEPERKAEPDSKPDPSKPKSRYDYSDMFDRSGRY